jgi:hypothetical protein
MGTSSFLEGYVPQISLKVDTYNLKWKSLKDQSLVHIGPVVSE